MDLLTTFFPFTKHVCLHDIYGVYYKSNSEYGHLAVFRCKIKGECRPFLRSVTAFGCTKIRTQILLDQL